MHLPLINLSNMQNYILMERYKYKIINGVWYGVPVTLESSVKELHKELFDDDDYTPSEKVKEISEKIINKTGCGE